MFRKREVIDVVDKTLCAAIIAFVILSGGKPISPIVYRALESIYQIELPTYSIPELMDIVDNESKQMALNTCISTMKIDIDSYQKLLDILKTKQITHIQIAGYKQGIVQIKIEGNNNVQKIQALTSSIKTSNGIKIIIDYLNEEELVLTVEKGVIDDDR